jgi:hypothetical protein
MGEGIAKREDNLADEVARMTGQNWFILSINQAEIN